MRTRDKGNREENRVGEKRGKDIGRQRKKVERTKNSMMGRVTSGVSRGDGERSEETRWKG